MKAVKGIAAGIFVIVLLMAEGLVMGLYAVDEALSEGSIQEHIVDTAIVEQLVDEALAESTVNMGGMYGDITKEVLQTEAMTVFFTDYLTAAIDAEIYGNAYEEVAYDELMRAFSQGIAEVNDSGEYTISPLEEEFLQQAIETEGPDLTAKLNQQVGNYEALSGDITELAIDPGEAIQTLLGTGVRIVLLAICAILCAAIIFLCWRSKLGFLWCTIVTGLVSLVYGILSLMGGGVLAALATSSSEEMLLGMIVGGFGAVAKAGFIITAVFLAVFIVFKLVDRRGRA